MSDKALTPGTSNNWLVQVGKRGFTLTQRQYDLVVEATQRDVKMLHFGDFSINLSYISFMEKVKKAKPYEAPVLPENIDKEGIAKLRKMKNDILGI